jgi:hypothetical protein
MISSRPATAEDLFAVYGDTVHVELEAITFLQDGRVAGITGLADLGDRKVLFSDLNDDFLPHLKTFAARRVIAGLIRQCAASQVPVMAVREIDSGLLERMGFECVDDDVYHWRA